MPIKYLFCKFTNLNWYQYYLFVFVILASLTVVCEPFPWDILAKTPSFVLQQIEDKNGDPYLSEQKNTIAVTAKMFDQYFLELPFATNMNQCKIEPNDIRGSTSLANDIKYVTYVSDGEMLNGTIWLSKPVSSLSEDSLSRSLWWKHLLLLDLPLDDNSDPLDILANRTINAIQPNFNITASDRTLLANNTPAQIITYEFQSSKDSAIYTSIITTINNKGLLATYHVPRAQYDNSSQIVDNMLDWIFAHPGYLMYEDKINGMSMEFPVDWTISPEDETGYTSSNGTIFNSSTYFFPGNGDGSRYPSLYLLIEDVPTTKNISLLDYVNTDIDNRPPNSNVTNYEYHSLGGNLSGSKYQLTYKIDETQYHNLNIILRNNEKVYYFQYLSKEPQYQKFLPTIKKMIESISTLTNSIKEDQNELGRAQIRSPLKDVMSDLYVNEVSYVLPASNISAVPWGKIYYIMSSYLESSYGESIFDNQIIWNTSSLQWDNFLMEASPKKQFLKVINQTNNFTAFYEPDKNYVEFANDLKAMNFPEKFRILFYTKYDYIKDGRYCPLVDIGDWGFVPTPEFNVTASPSSLNLRPGDQKDIRLTVKSNAQEDFGIQFLAGESDKGVNATFSPNNISVPVSADAITNLKVKALANASLGPATLPINMSILFKNKAISLNLNESIPNPSLTSIVKDLSLTMNVLPPDFSIKVVPASLELRRGDQKDIQVQINSSTNLNSKANLNATPPDPIEISFLPNPTYVNPLGIGTSTLHINIPREAKEISYPVPILAHIVTTNSSESIKSGANVSLHTVNHTVDETSQFTVTVLPDLTFEQHLENLSKLVGPLNLILGFLTAVGVILAPIILRRRKKARDEKAV